MTTPVFNAATAALAAAVPAARGWFRFGNHGAANVRLAGAVAAVQYDDSRWRIVALGAAQQFDLTLGPYDDETEAAEVADAVLRLAYNDLAWPAA